MSWMAADRAQSKKLDKDEDFHVASGDYSPDSTSKVKKNRTYKLVYPIFAKGFSASLNPVSLGVVQML